MRPRRFLLPSSLLASAALLFTPKTASADVSSWLYAGGGVGALQQGEAQTSAGALRLQLGMGSTPDAPFVLGGVAHTLSFFGEGTDLALSLRGATGGFARGDWGFALDAGGYQRFWGVGSSGLLGSLSLGAPFGLQAVLDFEMGTNDVRTFAAFLGIDLLRLTVYRTVGTQAYPNPLPAVR